MCLGMNPVGEIGPEYVGPGRKISRSNSNSVNVVNAIAMRGVGGMNAGYDSWDSSALERDRIWMKIGQKSMSRTGPR